MLDSPKSDKQNGSVMKSRSSFFLIITLLIGQFAFAQNYNSSSSATQQKGREFLMSCTYGVLTGALVGAASLAFTNNPGDKLHRVARGASLGLYAGIALGYYVTNYVEEGPGLAPQYNSYGGDSIPQKTSVFFFPILNEKGLDGLQIQYNFLSF